MRKPEGASAGASRLVTAVLVILCVINGGCATTPDKNLLQAIWDGDIEQTKTFIASGMNLNSCDARYGAPLHAAAMYNRVRIGKLLLENGASVNLTDGEGMTPLHVAADEQNEEFLEFLLENGAAPNLKDKKGNTPLHYACLTSVLVCVEDLLNHGATVNVLNSAGESPLHALARAPGLMKSAFEDGMPPEIAEYAEIVREEGVEIAALLMEHGADSSQKNDAGATALDVARAEGYEELVVFLESSQTK